MTSSPETTAETCWRDHFGSEGSAREHLVRLPDGFLLSCGIDGHSEARARDVARKITMLELSQITITRGHPDLVCTGIVNGMHEMDSGGAYFKLVATWADGRRDVLVISRGAARALSDEIDGCFNE